jgi:hypothetical protein
MPSTSNFTFSVHDALLAQLGVLAERYFAMIPADHFQATPVRRATFLRTLLLAMR